MDYEFKVGDTGVTNDGREFRVIADNKRGDKPVVALVGLPNGVESPMCFSTTGLYGLSPMRLLHPKRKLTLWLNVYADGIPYGFPYKHLADCRNVNRIACVEVEVEFTPGEGL